MTTHGRLTNTITTSRGRLRSGGPSPFTWTRGRTVTSGASGIFTGGPSQTACLPYCLIRGLATFYYFSWHLNLQRHEIRFLGLACWRENRFSWPAYVGMPTEIIFKNPAQGQLQDLPRRLLRPPLWPAPQRLV